jgi:serine/threonine protein kinase
VEDGGLTESLSPSSRSGSAQRQTRESCFTPVLVESDAVGRGVSYYYDVEEGEFQPSKRLLFRRTGSDLNYSSIADIVPSPLTIGSKLYQMTSGVPQHGIRTMRSASKGPPTTSVDKRGYFMGSYGATVGRGAFQIIACIGHGTYSSVWLALDVRGVTARVMPSMVHRMEDGSGYNSSASILNGSMQHAFVVLKVSRCLPEYIRACEEEFSTNKMLHMELQRRGFSTERFLLYPSSFMELASVNVEENPTKPVDALSATDQAAAPTDQSSNSSGAVHHVVQVGDVCGPSLLLLVTDAPPSRCGVTLADRRWRLMCVQFMIRQLLEASESLHQCGVVHSDIKPENILFSLPAVEFLEKMQSEARGGFPSAAQHISTYQSLVIARHRCDLVCHASAWGDLVQRHKHLSESGTESLDAARIACAIKLADLGSSLRIAANCTSPQKDGLISSSGSGSWSRVPSSGGPMRLPHATVTPCGSQPQLGSSLPSSIASSSRALTPSSQRSTCPILPGGSVQWTAQVLQTREYRSPEAILQLHPTSMISAGMDIWSIACVAFELATGHYLLHPRLVDLQQRQSNGAATEAENDDKVDAIHVAMMEDLLACPPPPELIAEGLASARLFPAASRGVSPRDPPSPEDCASRKERFLTALLHHHLNPECRLLQSTGRFESGSIEYDAAIRDFAQFLASALQWLPWDRPSAAELLQCKWVRQRTL